jgi:hypothetical protein
VRPVFWPIESRPPSEPRKLFSMFPCTKSKPGNIGWVWDILEPRIIKMSKFTKSNTPPPYPPSTRPPIENTVENRAKSRQNDSKKMNTHKIHKRPAQYVQIVWKYEDFEAENTTNTARKDGNTYKQPDGWPRALENFPSIVSPSPYLCAVTLFGLHNLRFDRLRISGINSTLLVSANIARQCTWNAFFSISIKPS